ncbi:MULTISPECIES: HEPN domain-containing protein [Bacteroidota]|uniref:HEPN domain-containing protein n=1 Tax=Bacteroidota TaxID=976 RepID=UPI00257FF613|nr:MULTISPECIES: hypothetical protein [Bacteroidota]
MSDKLSFEKISIRPTEECVRRLGLETDYKIESDFETINGIDCTLTFNKSEFRLGAKDLNRNLKNEPYIYQRVCYGFCERFSIFGDNTGYLIERGMKTFKMNHSEEYAYSGTISELKPLAFDNEAKYFFRCIFGFPSTLEANLISYFITSPFETESVRYAGGLLKILVKGVRLHIYLSKINDDNFLIFDTFDKCYYEKFEKIVEAISLNYQLLSGVKVREKRLIFRSENAEFESPVLHSFKKLKTDVNGFPSLLMPRDLLSFYPSLEKKERYLNGEIFAKLVEQSLDDIRILRVISMIVNSFELPLEIKASTYCVGLETFKDVILSENSNKINPIKDKGVSKEIRERFKTIIDEYSENAFNNRQAVISKINNLNQTTNSDGFIKMFEVIGIQLTEADKDAISKRNDFLHGRVPLESVDGDDKMLHYIVYSLHFLLIALILKKAGFSGYLLELINFEQVKKGESPFRLI